MYASYEIGLTKPDPAIFKWMMADAPLIPAETLFVDDGPANIQTAQTLGFQTYQPGNGEDWREAVSFLIDNGQYNVARPFLQKINHPGQGKRI